MEYAVSFFMMGEVARLTVAVIFALAAFHAMREWTAFGGIIEQYRVAPRWVAIVVARILPPLELTTAAALVLPPASHAGAALGLCLMAMFTAAIALNLVRGRVSIDCGCGGAGGQKLSMGLVLRNLMVMAGLALAWTTPAAGVVDAATMVGVVGASLALIALYFAANQLMTNFQMFNT
jgi:Methylamine utilisation protein MauE